MQLLTGAGISMKEEDDHSVHVIYINVYAIYENGHLTKMFLQILMLIRRRTYKSVTSPFPQRGQTLLSSDDGDLHPGIWPELVGDLLRHRNCLHNLVLIP